MRRIVEQQRRHSPATHYFEHLEFVIGRITALCSRQVRVALAKQQVHRPVFVGDGLVNGAEDFFRQLSSVIEVRCGNLNGPLVIVRGQQHQIRRRNA